MIIERYLTPNALWGIQERLGDVATRDDALACLQNLVDAGWLGWDTVDIPDDVFVAAASGPVEQ